MKEIPATKGHTVLVDDEDFERLSRFRWFAHNSGRAGRAARRTSTAEGRKCVYLHHEILKLGPGLEVDHINGNPWDNRRCNLRLATRAQNARNSSRRSQTKTFKGVYRRGGRFYAAICVDRRRIYLGTFANEEAAAQAYDEAAIRYHGEFARLNLSPISGASL